MSLAMVAAHYSLSPGLPALRERFRLSGRGLRLTDLAAFATELGFASRAVKAEMHNLHEMTLPAIIHWNFNHFVVLAKIGKRRITIHDPAQGRRVLTRAEFSRSFTGVGLELKPLAGPAAAISQPAGLPRWPKRLFGRIAVLAAFGAVLQLPALSTVVALQLLLDLVTGQGDMRLLIGAACVFATVQSIGLVGDALRQWNARLVAAELQLTIGDDVVARLLHLPRAFVDNRAPADFAERLSSAVAGRAHVSTAAAGAIADLIGLILIAALLFLYSPLLAALSLLAAGIAAAARLIVDRLGAFRGPGVRLSSRTILQESIDAVDVIHAAAAEGERHAAWRAAADREREIEVSTARGQILSSATETIIRTFGLIGITVLAARMVLGGNLSVGMLAASLALAWLATDRAARLDGAVRLVRKLSFSKVVLDDIYEATQADEVLEEQVGDASIALEKASFTYGPSDPPVLENVSLRVETGRMLVIQGPPGAGKTTLLKLLAGLLIPTSGKVLLGRGAATPAQWRSWRRGCGYLGQDDLTVAGSVARNIAFPDKTVDMHRVIDVARKVGLHGLIMSMPMRYRTEVERGGANLSAAQAQLLLLARTLYRNPKVLLLDEALTHLDEESEQRVADLLAGLKITRIIVSRSPGIARTADVIVSLSGGAIHPAAPSSKKSAATIEFDSPNS